MFPLQMIIYLLIELEPTEKNQLKEWFIDQKKRWQNFGQVDSKNFVVFSLLGFEI
jgi:hypothetical protein